MAGQTTRRGETIPERPFGLLREIAASIGNRWPWLEFTSLAFYSAWILLAVTSNEAVSALDATTSGSLQGTLYLSSGVALTLCLLVAGALSKHVQPFIEQGPLVPIMGGIASACTFVLMGGLGTAVGAAAFVACGIGTGIGTSAVCLRTGLVTSKLNGTSACFAVGAVALLANLIFFMCQAVAPAVSLWIISLLPFMAAATSFMSSSNRSDITESDDLIDIRSLPKGYFPRLMLMVFVFALAAGVVKGLAGLSSAEADLLGSKISTWEVLLSFLAVLLFLIAATVFLSFKNFEIGKLYVPVGFLTVIGILLCPLLGGFVTVQGIIVNVLYNVFILIVWCLLIELAGRTTLGAVRVFGFGRGASALATTLGWAIALFADQMLGNLASLYTAFFVVMAVAMLVVLVLIFNEQTVSAALEKTLLHEVEGSKASDAERERGLGVGFGNDLWTLACQQIASEHRLTVRESEVYSLLAKGRSVSYIADELVIAQSTVKGYTKNIYAKIGVHSRQELIDVTDVRMAELLK